MCSSKCCPISHDMLLPSPPLVFCRVCLQWASAWRTTRDRTSSKSVKAAQRAEVVKKELGYQTLKEMRLERATFSLLFSLFDMSSLLSSRLSSPPCGRGPAGGAVQRPLGAGEPSRGLRLEPLSVPAPVQLPAQPWPRGVQALSLPCHRGHTRHGPQEALWLPGRVQCQGMSKATLIQSYKCWLFWIWSGCAFWSYRFKSHDPCIQMLSSYLFLLSLLLEYIQTRWMM